MRRTTTIADVVRLTGLSRATVDRVINERGKVKAATREKVAAAVAELRYSQNRLSSLVSGEVKKVLILLPQGKNPLFAELQREMETAAEQAPSAQYAFDTYDPYKAETLVERLATVGDDVNALILSGVDDPDVAEKIERLESRGVRVVMVLSGMSGTRAGTFVGQNNFQAGRLAGRLMAQMLCHKAGSVGILIGTLALRHLLDRRSGFEQFLSQYAPELHPVNMRPYGSDAGGFRGALEKLIADNADLKGIYLCGSGQPEIYDAVREIGPDLKFIAHEITSCSRKALADGTLDFLVASDMGELGQEAVAAAIADKSAAPKRVRTLIYMAENLPSLHD